MAVELYLYKVKWMHIEQASGFPIHRANRVKIEYLTLNFNLNLIKQNSRVPGFLFDELEK